MLKEELRFTLKKILGTAINICFIEDFSEWYAAITPILLSVKQTEKFNAAFKILKGMESQPHGLDIPTASAINKEETSSIPSMNSSQNIAKDSPFLKNLEIYS